LGRKLGSIPKGYRCDKYYPPRPAAGLDVKTGIVLTLLE
jgi:hypothetical protein